jgi:hypothetical protein
MPTSESTRRSRMAKQNAMLAKIEAKYALQYAIELEKAKARYLRQLDIALQQSSDAAMMAIDDVFDVNAYSAEKFHVAHVQYVNKMASLLLEDYESDPSMEYTKTDIDRRLKQIVGEDNFVPWDERYGEKNG